MQQPDQLDKTKFLYPRNRYCGQVKPENMLFNANLQEFAQRVSYIYNLGNSGKLDLEEAFSRIEHLWDQLERSKKQLGSGE